MLIWISWKIEIKVEVSNFIMGWDRMGWDRRQISWERGVVYDLSRGFTSILYR